LTRPFDPWRHVEADDDLVADLLAGSLESVVDLGGWIHPSARLVVRDGQATVECDAEAEELLLRIPVSAMVRIGRVPWTSSRQELGFDAVPDEFGPARPSSSFCRRHSTMRAARSPGSSTPTRH